MSHIKRMKDPIYGYVDIPVKYMLNIIDTPSYQRLRRIIQTSYSPLYSSAVHNRFVHSIGVYHLGSLSYNSLEKAVDIDKSLVDIDRSLFEKIGGIFILACLLHDIGHAPFSHTGESFYLDETNGYLSLHNQLAEIINSENFLKDIPSEKSKAAAPHEIMSAIVGLREYCQCFVDSDDKELFARCITGYKYTTPNKEDSIRNCFIELLNSKIIDVDKLDYLIRDAYITGFNTISLDYVRLLSSLTFIKDENQDYQLAYNKSAISVIENVVYAHDSERKWIQSHPVVLYESYILQHIFAGISKNINSSTSKLFSLESLSEQGQNFRIGEYEQKIRLLCDDDIIHLLKNVYYESLGKEYFERRLRMHPFWKSESEYKSLVLDTISGGDALSKFEGAMKSTAEYLDKNTETKVIDDNLIAKIESEINAIDSKELDPKTKEAQKRQKHDMLKIMNCLREYAGKEMTFKFVILKASQFNSGFGKPDFSNINIVFGPPSNRKVKKFGKIVSTISAKESARDDFFYLFYQRDLGKDSEIDSTALINKLFVALISS